MNRNMNHFFFHGSNIVRLIVTIALCLMLVAAVFSGRAQRSAVFEERAAALANEMSHVNADQARAAVEMAAMRAKLEAMNDQLITLKAYAAGALGLLTILQIISGITGRHIRRTQRDDR